MISRTHAPRVSIGLTVMLSIRFIIIHLVELGTRQRLRAKVSWVDSRAPTTYENIEENMFALWFH